MNKFCFLFVFGIVFGKNCKVRKHVYCVVSIHTVHCPKNNLNLQLGTFTVASAPTVTGFNFKPRLRLLLVQCTSTLCTVPGKSDVVNS